jgi:hypothetical protein
VCKKCAKKQDAQSLNKKEVLFGVGLPSAFVGVIIGLFLGWLFFVVIKKKKNQKKK